MKTTSPAAVVAKFVMDDTDDAQIKDLNQQQIKRKKLANTKIYIWHTMFALILCVIFVQFLKKTTRLSSTHANRFDRLYTINVNIW